VKRALKIVGWGIVAVTVFVACAWAAAALAIDVRVSWLRAPLALVFTAAVVVSLVLVRPLYRALGVIAVLWLAVLCWWFTLSPSNSRDWAPDVARTANVTIDGDVITVENFRDFDYRTESDFTPTYERRTFRFSQLESIDFFCSYWAGPSIAHTFVSYGFADGQHLVVSVETRKERGEEYSAVRGFFRQFELIYVLGDERDIVRVRTNYRGERVYCYRAKLLPGRLEAKLREDLARAGHLAEHPEWYNALTDNCTNNIFGQGGVPAMAVVFKPKIVLTGYTDEYLYELGKFATQVPFPELKERSNITALAKAADQAPDFSQRIRANQVIPE